MVQKKTLSETYEALFNGELITLFDACREAIRVNRKERPQPEPTEPDGLLHESISPPGDSASASLPGEVRFHSASIVVRQVDPKSRVTRPSVSVSEAWFLLTDALTREKKLYGTFSAVVFHLDEVESLWLNPAYPDLVGPCPLACVSRFAHYRYAGYLPPEEIVEALIRALDFYVPRNCQNCIGPPRRIVWVLSGLAPTATQLTVPNQLVAVDLSNYMRCFSAEDVLEVLKKYAPSLAGFDYAKADDRMKFCFTRLAGPPRVAQCFFEALHKFSVQNLEDMYGKWSLLEEYIAGRMVWYLPGLDAAWDRVVRLGCLGRVRRSLYGCRFGIVLWQDSDVWTRLVEKGLVCCSGDDSGSGKSLYPPYFFLMKVLCSRIQAPGLILESLVNQIDCLRARAGVLSFSRYDDSRAAKKALELNFVASLADPRTKSVSDWVRSTLHISDCLPVSCDVATAKYEDYLEKTATSVRNSRDLTSSYSGMASSYREPTPNEWGTDVVFDATLCVDEGLGSTVSAVQPVRSIADAATSVVRSEIFYDMVTNELPHHKGEMWSHTASLGLNRANRGNQPYTDMPATGIPSSDTGACITTVSPGVERVCVAVKLTLQVGLQSSKYNVKVNHASGRGSRCCVHEAARDISQMAACAVDLFERTGKRTVIVYGAPCLPQLSASELEEVYSALPQQSPVRRTSDGRKVLRQCLPYMRVIVNQPLPREKEALVAGKLAAPFALFMVHGSDSIWSYMAIPVNELEGTSFVFMSQCVLNRFMWSKVSDPPTLEEMKRDEQEPCCCPYRRGLTGLEDVCKSLRKEERPVVAEKVIQQFEKAVTGYNGAPYRAAGRVLVLKNEHLIELGLDKKSAAAIADHVLWTYDTCLLPLRTAQKRKADEEGGKRVINEAGKSTKERR